MREHYSTPIDSTKSPYFAAPHDDRVTEITGALVEQATRRAVFLGIPEPSAQWHIHKGQLHIEAGLSACESPIEQMMLPHLVLGDWHGFLTFPVPVFLPTWDYAPPCDILIVPQFRFGRYRFDFAMICDGGAKIFDVECDSAMWHDTAKDLERDRYLTRIGIHVIRSIGADIVRDSFAAAQRIITVITAWKASQGGASWA